MALFPRPLIPLRSVLSALPVLLLSTTVAAQNGLSDERVVLPDGPGSIGGVGENLAINPNLGSASFGVSVRVPAGETEALTPRMSLRYASSSGQGMLGIGWDFAMPRIERMVSRGLPTYGVDDFFAVDGSDEIVYVGDVGGAREYRARYEKEFVRYRWYNAGPGGYWTAETPDGMTMTYGATPDGSPVANARVDDGTGQTFCYHLVQTEDTSGRKMVYTYDKDDGSPRLNEIQYGFGPLTTPRFSVRVNYELRPDLLTTATSGAVLLQRYRASSIQISSLDAVIRRYTMTYESPAVSGGVSRLASVQEFGRDNGLLPIVHTFGYSRALAGPCETGCDEPFVVDMGTLPGGVNIQTGRASLIDINGDALPDIVSSDDLGAHTFHIATLAADGRAFFNSTPVTSTMGGLPARFILGSPSVQLLDINGDGMTDIVNQQTGTALCNFGNGDWESTNCNLSADQLPPLPDDADDPPSESDPDGMRFFDFDNDKRIDLLRTPAVDAAFVERNTGTGFETITIDPLGARFDQEALQLTDINGDGLQDPVQLIGNGTSSTLRYQINLGFGKWTAPVDVTIAGLNSTELDLAALEDLDGDGLPDVVVVAGNTVSVWRNENNGVFAARSDVVSADVNGVIPERDSNQTVLFADMNGNGTDDVVWVRNDGNVTFLELFPVRPNLLARIDNGIGWVRTLTYTTSIAERARDEGTPDAWTSKTPNAMVVVKSTDTYVTLNADESTGLHEVDTYAYRQAYYDGGEKAFRGFALVEKTQDADRANDFQDPGREVLVYEVGIDDTYRFGLERSRAVFGGPDGTKPIQSVEKDYADCPIAEVPAGLDPPVRYICQTAERTTFQEGDDVSKWKTTEFEYTYDGYGNIIETFDHGVRFAGDPGAPAACAVCDAPAGTESGACGAQCLGDERVTTKTFIVPGAATGGRWLLNLMVREVTANNDGTDPLEMVWYYDGPDFEGLAEGQATRGLMTRAMQRATDSTLLPAERNAYDARGNRIASLDPNGDPSDPTRNRRDYTFDERGMRIVTTTIRAGDYDLVRDTIYEASFLKPSESTAFYVVDSTGERTPRNSVLYRYDEHARTRSIIRPGDTELEPTWEYTYALGDPTTKITLRGRRTPGGVAEVETIQCFDGRGREVQTRQKTATGSYIVSGFNETNARGAVVKNFEPYTSNSAECDAAPPAGTLFTTTRYDTAGRVLETTLPDESLYGTASIMRMEYEPLVVIQYDQEDTDAQSPHFDTPLRRTYDGLGRTITFERLLSPTDLAVYRYGYDPRSNLAAIVDPAGNLKTQDFDLAGRVLTVDDPNAGTTTYLYNAASRIVDMTDARGVIMRHEYDALNRLVSRFDVADRAGTEESTVYDLDEGCTLCRNGAGKIVAQQWPSTTGPQRELRGYDPRGRNVYFVRELDGVSFETLMEYDGMGALLSTTYPDGQVVTNIYDNALRPIGTANLVSNATYDDRGNLATIARANGVTTTLSYDSLQRASAVAHGAFFDIALTRDRADNVVSQTSTGTGISHAGAYAYDAWYRLTEATVGADDEVVSLVYDKMDNITSQTSSVAASAVNLGAYAYAGTPNAVTSAGGRAYAYDAAGQMTARGAVDLTWDFAGRVASASTDTRSSTMNYSPDTVRVVKAEDGGVTLYPMTGMIVRDGISSVYVTFGGQIVARMQSDALATEILPDANADGQIDIADAVTGVSALRERFLRSAARRLLFASAGTVTYLHEDALGSLVALSDDTGAVVAERSFYPLGEDREQTAFVDTLGFTAQEKDDVSGLYHFQARMLDTGVGRWISPDPLFGISTARNIEKLGESTTDYAYVGNNPTNFVDPTGLNAISKAKGPKKLAGRRYKRQKRINTAKHVTFQTVGTLFPPLRVVSGIATAATVSSYGKGISAKASINQKMHAKMKGKKISGPEMQRKSRRVKERIQKGGIKGAVARVGLELKFAASVTAGFTLGATTKPNALFRIRKIEKIR